MVHFNQLGSYVVPRSQLNCRSRQLGALFIELPQGFTIQPLVRGGEIPCLVGKPLTRPSQVRQQQWKLTSSGFVRRQTPVLIPAKQNEAASTPQQVFELRLVLNM